MDNTHAPPAPPPSVASVVDALGRERLAADLGVTNGSIRAALAEGKFPAAWYRVVMAAALRENVDCPIGLFRMRPARDDAEARS